MNYVKLLTPDFAPGKILVTGKAIVDIGTLLAQQPTKQSLKFAKLILQVKPHYTMVTNKSLINLYCLVQSVNNCNIPGDIIECGVWNGGSAAIMGVACKEQYGLERERKIWLFDSFEGLPRPGERDAQSEQKFYFKGWNKGSEAKVRQIFQKLHIPLSTVNIVPGWFEDTLSVAPVEQIAILHVDADWYDSVKLVLDKLYDRVVAGGFVVLDDYGYWEGCNRAVEDFFVERSLQHIPIKRVGRVGAYFQKP